MPEWVKSVKLLCLEDSQLDAELLREYLREQFDLNTDFHHVDNEEDFVAALREGTFDVVLADYSLPGFDALAALARVTQLAPGTPVICVTGALGDDLAVELLKQGAADYVLKEKLTRLPLAIKRAVAEGAKQKLLNNAELAREKSDVQFRAIFEQAPLGMALIQQNSGYPLRYNNRFQEILAVQEIEGINILRFLEIEEAVTALRADWGGKGLGLERRLARGNLPVWLNITVAPVEEGDGLVYLLVMVEDISNKKRTEAELQVAVNAAKAADIAKSKFLANMSHEIRTPLNAIIGVSELLVESGLTAEQRKLVDMFASAGDYLLGLINNILDMAKIDAGSLELLDTDFDLEALIPDP